MTTEQMYAALAAAMHPYSDVAVIRLAATYQPAGGVGARVFPPTYPSTADGRPPYVIEQRLRDGVPRKAALLDSTPSQANRTEEALLRAHRAGQLSVPMLELRHQGRAQTTITSLEAPHRYSDAYFRDSTLDGIALDKSDVGRRLQAATMGDVGALFSHDPGSLVFGAWNSHRPGRQVKFPRVYASEIIGWDPEVGDRRAGRMDPLNLVGSATPSGDEWDYTPVRKVKGATPVRKVMGAKKLSEIGLGNIAPNPAHGGVTVTSAERIGTISFTGLRRLGFGDADDDAATAARVALAALALASDRLAFAGATVWLRSGCELVAEADELLWVKRGNVTEPWELGARAAVELFTHARTRASDLGLAMADEPVVLTPNKALAEAIDFSLTKAEASED